MPKRSGIKKIAIIVVALILLGLFANSYFYKDHQDGDIDWPSVGQAAIGSVEEGILARSSNNERLRPIASMAKVITALAIMERRPFKPGQQGETYTITEDDIASMNAYMSDGGSVLPILVGMRLTQYQALQRILIASDNTIADILVERIFGSMESYTAYAQNMLKRMGLNRTIVADASGFSSETASTPSELIAIGIAALKNSIIAKIVSQQQAQVPVAGNIKNTNQLLGTNGIIGIKTGTTDAAGSCLLLAARYTFKDGQKRTIVGVIMGDKNHRSLYSDTKSLLASARHVFDTVAVKSTHNANEQPLKERKRKTSRNI